MDGEVRRGLLVNPELTPGFRQIPLPHVSGGKSMLPESIAYELLKQQQGVGGKRPRWPIPPQAPEEEVDVDGSSVSSSDEEETVDEDDALVGPLPIIAFLQARIPAKACGHCAECRKPPCGRCRSCEQNAGLTPAELRKSKRRCEGLQCIRHMNAPQVSVEAPPGQKSLPASLEGVRQELDVIKSKIKHLDAHRGTDRFSESRATAYAERKAALLSAAKKFEAPRKVRFPVGFADTWGVVNAMEKHRHKFAAFVVKQRHAGDARTLVSKREMRDLLDGMILQFCSRFGEYLAPVNEADAFWHALSQRRTIKHHHRQ